MQTRPLRLIQVFLLLPLMAASLSAAGLRWCALATCHDSVQESHSCCESPAPARSQPAEDEQQGCCCDCDLDFTLNTQVDPPTPEIEGATTSTTLPPTEANVELTNCDLAASPPPLRRYLRDCALLL
jgi:hypothetical protein